MSRQQQLSDEEQQLHEVARQHEVARRVQRQFHTQLAATYLKACGCPLQEALRVLATKRK